MLAGLAVCGGVVLGLAQLWLAQATGVLQPAQVYEAGNDTQQYQQALIVW